MISNEGANVFSNSQISVSGNRPDVERLRSELDSRLGLGGILRAMVCDGWLQW